MPRGNDVASCVFQLCPLGAVLENEPALLSELLGRIIAGSSQIWEITGQIAIYTNQKKKLLFDYPRSNKVR